MIEIKVAAKEVVRVMFGGSHGFPPYECVLDQEHLEATKNRLEALENYHKRTMENINVEGARIERLEAEKHALQRKIAAREVGSEHCEHVQLKGRVKHLEQALQDYCKDSLRDSAEMNRLAVENAALKKTISEKQEAFDFWHQVASGGKSPWGPIETAPKNGECIIGASVKGAVIVEWSKYCERWCIFMGDGFVEPTHWMPLPDLPK